MKKHISGEESIKGVSLSAGDDFPVPIIHPVGGRRGEMGGGGCGELAAVFTASPVLSQIPQVLRVH